MRDRWHLRYDQATILSRTLTAAVCRQYLLRYVAAKEAARRKSAATKRTRFGRLKAVAISRTFLPAPSVA